MYTGKDLDHARKRVAEMTSKQLLTRLGRMTVPKKLWAFEKAIAEYMESRSTVDEVTEYYGVYLRVHNRLGIEPHKVERSLSEFISKITAVAATQVAATSSITFTPSPTQGKAKAPRRRLTIE